MENEENLDMENIETPAPQEEETDNSQKSDDIPDPKEKRHAEQMAGSKLEVERLRGLASDLAFKEASKDVSTLRELYDQDPKLAIKTATRFDRENSQWGSFDNFLVGKEVTKSSISEDELETLLTQREEKREHQKALSNIEKAISKLPEETQEQVQAYVDKYSRGLKLTTETADELLDMATLYVNRDKLKSEKKEELKAKLSSTGIKDSSKKSQDDMVTVIRNGKLVLIPTSELS